MPVLTKYVTCDSCQSVYDIARSNFVRRSTIDLDIEEVGHTCPVCDTEIVVYRTNSEIRDLQANVAQERERFRKKIAAGYDPGKAEANLKRALRRLEKAFKGLNSKT